MRKLKHVKLFENSINTKEDWEAVIYRMDSEGIGYCFEHYSNFDEIKDEEFHRLRKELLKSINDIRKYVKEKAE